MITSALKLLLKGNETYQMDEKSQSLVDFYSSTFGISGNDMDSIKSHILTQKSFADTTLFEIDKTAKVANVQVGDDPIETLKEI